MFAMVKISECFQTLLAGTLCFPLEKAPLAGSPHTHQPSLELGVRPGAEGSFVLNRSLQVGHLTKCCQLSLLSPPSASTRQFLLLTSYFRTRPLILQFPFQSQPEVPLLPSAGDPQLTSLACDLSLISVVSISASFPTPWSPP